MSFLGFFSTYNSLVPGNMGIQDQIAALKWVKVEIPKFGGNANLITVFGESAGGASTSLLTISPKSKGESFRKSNLFILDNSDGEKKKCSWNYLLIYKFEGCLLYKSETRKQYWCITRD